MKYKAKDCFEMKNIAGDVIVIPRGEIAIEFNGVLVLNETCVLLWEKMSNFVSIDELADMLVEAYGIDKEIALKDTKTCIDKMLENELLEVDE